MIEPHHTIIISPAYRFQWEEAQQCYVLLYPEGMVQLNFSAGEILKHCGDSPKTAAQLIQILQNAFPDVADIQDDIFAFLEVAHRNGWINVVE